MRGPCGRARLRASGCSGANRVATRKAATTTPSLPRWGRICVGALLTQERFPMLIDKHVAMTTRDGVTLRADVYRPDGPGRFPVLLSRLPYDKNLRRRPGDIDVFVERGYVVIMQDTRGRFASAGDEYYPLVWEAQDGYDAVEWAAGLPYSDGQVGTVGQSYLGATQYLLAPTRPPHLRASFPASAPADFHQCWVYHSGGAFELGWQIPYAILMARDTIARRGLTDTLLPELERERAAVVAGQRGASARADQRAHVPRDLLVRHLPARRPRELLRAP